MPSHKPIKTYEKRTRLQIKSSTKSVDAINALFAQNLTKRLKSRRKAKLKLKELPPRIETYMTDDSLKVEPDNTFDRVLRGKVYNEVKVGKFVKIKSSDSEASKPQISVSFHSPIMTRRRKKTGVIISEISDKKTEKSSTLDKPVTSSCLSIEKENNKAVSVSSLSYIKLPKITDKDVPDKLFTDTFRERQAVHSSTPYLAANKEKIVVDTISPITKSDSSRSSKLLEKSYDQIRQWDEIFPTESETPKRKSEVKTRRRKLSAATKNGDWKLLCEPKVHIKPSDIISGKLEFKGFSGEEQSSSSRESSRVQFWLKTLPVAENTKNNLKNNSQMSKKSLPRTRNSKINSKNDETAPKRKYKKRSMIRSRYSQRLSENVTQRKTSTGSLPKKKSVDSRKNSVSSSRRKSSVVSASKRSVNAAPRKTNVSSAPRKSKADLQSTGKLYIPLTRVSVNKSERRSRRLLRVLLTPLNNIRKGRTSSTPLNESFVTLRRRHPIRNVKKIDVVSSSRKSKIKKELCINVTEEILSEKEVSYSPSSFDFSSPSKIQDKTEELKQEKEVVLSDVSTSLTVDLKDFDSFMKSYYGDDETETKKEEKKETQNVVPATALQSETTNPRSLQFLISPRKSPNTSPKSPGSSKIIILSDIKLSPISMKKSLYKTLQDVFHDHSYSNSPKPPDLVQNESTLSDIIEASILPELENGKTGRKVQKPIKIRPGKSYRRSLSLLKRSSVLVDVKNSVCHKDCICLKCLFRSKINPDTSRKSSLIVPVSPGARKSLNRSVLEKYARSTNGYVRQEESYVGDLDESVRGLSLNPRSSSIQENLEVVTAKEVVLRRCGQTEILPFEECYPRCALQHCQKIGEGVYGEVFLYRNPNAAAGGIGAPTTVMKIIPIEGDQIVNGERQKKFDEILSEIVITMELSNLRNNKKNNTTSFAEVQKVRCVQGSYPDRLLDLWELYDETKGSENDSPQILPPSQKYIILEMANGGKDLESYVFTNAQQAYAMFKQTALALAVAENELKFEHRDLHWGNVLINAVDKGKVVRFRLDGKEIEVDSCGVEVAIIDFTLSRIEFDGVVIFNDLSRDDELFVAEGDYQFDVYRLMQKSNGNDWQKFEPFTNILWLDYLLDKTMHLRYKNPRTKIHKEYLTKLQTLRKQLEAFHSVVDFVKDMFI